MGSIVSRVRILFTLVKPASSSRQNSSENGILDPVTEILFRGQLLGAQAPDAE